MKAYWDNLNERERWVAGFGLLFSCLYIFYSLVISPLNHSIDEKSKQLVEKKETLRWMQGVRAQSHQTKTKQGLSNSQLLAMLAKELPTSSFKHYPYQLQQTGVGDIQLSFEQVTFNAFMKWLWSLNEKYAFTIKQLTTERTDQQGVVKLLIILESK